VKGYGKFIAQVAATGIAAIIAGLVDDRLDYNDWLNVGFLALGAVGVLGAGNLPAGVWRYTKSFVAAASAVLVLWQSLASGGMTISEWLQLAVAALGALGVFAVRGPVVYDAAALGRAAAGTRPGPII
jgi:hypothetical protein